MRASRSGKAFTLLSILTARLNRSFLLLPLLVSLSGLCCALVVIGWGAALEDAAGRLFPAPDIQTVRSVLSTIAGSALTVLSLVYSLTLVVFTLAAGNISPRLLTRFAEDTMIQMTAGILAATFFYAVMVLQRADTVPPSLATGVAVAWSVGSIAVLIVFIHKVATRITMDEEIGRIGASLGANIDRILEEAEDEDPTDGKADAEDCRPEGEIGRLLAARSGYVAAVDLETLLRVASKHDLFVEVKAPPGQFSVEGCALASYVGKPTDEALRTMRGAFVISRQRTPEADLDFSILLLVEIAQRALSPGINDGFTAIAVIDHLSAAFARILRRRPPSPLTSDDQDVPRVWLENADISRLLATAYHPLRRNAAGNVTVTLRLLASLQSLAHVARPQYRGLLASHVRLIAEDMKAAEANPRDQEDVLSLCREILESLGEGDQAEPA
ncbi:DUF2254 domain-containing protein [Breoghania sp.]|uniref:DUF2254 domain-containing protein n=1 Tax=Breoghania sp. TaxID=2065378 RepID=UPI0029CA33C9|nr:DUF2254 domain-containing protein [Breoghania sp.]